MKNGRRFKQGKAQPNGHTSKFSSFSCSCDYEGQTCSQEEN